MAPLQPNMGHAPSPPGEATSIRLKMQKYFLFDTLLPEATCHARGEEIYVQVTQDVSSFSATTYIILLFVWIRVYHIRHE